MVLEVALPTVSAVGFVLLVMFIAFFWLEHQRSMIAADALKAAAAKAAAKREAAEPGYCQR